MRLKRKEKQASLLRTFITLFLVFRTSIVKSIACFRTSLNKHTVQEQNKLFDFITKGCEGME